MSVNVRSEDIAALSRWVDDSPTYVGLDPEAALWRRTMKVAEEAGEVYRAVSGMLGENPRKGVTASREEVIDELLDCALAALAAVEHLTGNEGRSLGLFAGKVEFVTYRAGLREATA